MEITLLGTGTGVPSLRRNPPCISIKFPNKTAIFDSGSGSLKSLFQNKIDYLDLDYIFYTHLHLDHVSELSAILFASKIPPTIRKKPLAIYGPSGLNDYYKKIRELYNYTLHSDEYPLDISEIENKEIKIEGHGISTRTLKHHDGGMGYRIVSPQGKVVVYSGDTDYCDEVIELSKDADLLILECSFPDQMAMKGHLSPTTAGRIAQRAKAKKLVFVHMYPICDKYDLVAPCKKEYNGELIVGEDLMKFNIT